MDVVARSLHEPALDQRRFVGAGVVEHQMRVKPLGHAPVNGIEEVPKLDAPVPLADHGTGLDIQSGEEVRCTQPTPNL